MFKRLEDEFEAYDIAMGRLVDEEADAVVARARECVINGTIRAYLPTISKIDRAIAMEFVMELKDEYGIWAMQVPPEDGCPDEFVEFLTSNNVRYTSEGHGTLMVNESDPAYPGDYLIVCNKLGVYVVSE